MIPITELYKKTQDELFTFVKEFIEKKHPGAFTIELGKNDMYIACFPKGDQKPYPVLASHLDTYNNIYPDTVVQSKVENDTPVYIGKKGDENCVLGADDRNGVWTMLKLIEAGKTDWGYIFTKDEEIGRIGAIALRATSLLQDHLKDIAYFIQIDRLGTSEIVHYRLGDIEGNPRSHNNQEFICKLNSFTGLEVFASDRSTDVKEFCGATAICGINISAGYFNEHHPRPYDDPNVLYEYSNIEYVNNLPGTIIKLIEHLGNKQYIIET